MADTQKPRDGNAKISWEPLNAKVKMHFHMETVVLPLLPYGVRDSQHFDTIYDSAFY